MRIRKHLSTTLGALSSGLLTSLCKRYPTVTKHSLPLMVSPLAHTSHAWIRDCNFVGRLQNEERKFRTESSRPDPVANGSLSNLLKQACQETSHYVLDAYLDRFSVCSSPRTEATRFASLMPQRSDKRCMHYDFCRLLS